MKEERRLISFKLLSSMCYWDKDDAPKLCTHPSHPDVECLEENCHIWQDLKEEKYENE